MSPCCCRCDDARPSAAALNEEIRQLVTRTGVWTPEALAELARLRAEWRTAVNTEARAA
jgi:hypothetical protein